jgi:hypothetical protein
MREQTRHVIDQHIALDVHVGGFCPVMGQGTVDGRRLYFAAQNETWHFAVAGSPEVDPAGMTSREGGFYSEEVYEGKARSAGWRCAEGYAAEQGLPTTR